MSHQPINDDEILDHLDAPTMRIVHPFPDPDTETSIPVTLDQIKAYDRNPRKQRNPLYAEIKESIALRGLDQAPKITRRPGDDLYMIAVGGNTRLQILNELWTETQGEQFYRFNWVFKPWAGDVATLIAHFSENHDRSPILFIERALAAVELRQAIGKEKQSPLTSLRNTAEAFNAAGWKTDATTLGRYDYAVNSLLQHTPDALWAGAGRPFVQKVRADIARFTRYWSCIEAGQETPNAVDELYFETLAGYDDVIAMDIASSSSVLAQVSRTVSAGLADLAGLSRTTFDAEVHLLADGMLTPETVTDSVYPKTPDTVSEPANDLANVGPDNGRTEADKTNTGSPLTTEAPARVEAQARMGQAESAAGEDARTSPPYPSDWPRDGALLERADHIATLAQKLPQVAKTPGALARTSDDQAQVILQQMRQIEAAIGECVNLFGEHHP